MSHFPQPDHILLLSSRILVVEDDDCLYRALLDSLQDAGCEVLGSCEREYFSVETVPVSRLDAALVDMDPLGSARAAGLARQLDARFIPTVWITSRYDRHGSAVVQPHQWLQKPFNERELLDSIACAVSKRRGLAESNAI